MKFVDLKQNCIWKLEQDLGVTKNRRRPETSLFTKFYDLETLKAQLPMPAMISILSRTLSSDNDQLNVFYIIHDTYLHIYSINNNSYQHAETILRVVAS